MSLHLLAAQRIGDLTSFSILLKLGYAHSGDASESQFNSLDRSFFFPFASFSITLF